MISAARVGTLACAWVRSPKDYTRDTAAYAYLHARIAARYALQALGRAYPMRRFNPSEA